MLKITTQQDVDVLNFKLEGKVAGLWVDELERSWHVAAGSAKAARVLVDLSEVTFVDVEGKKLLSWMCGQGAEFICAGCMTKGIVEEIKRERPACHEAPGNRGTR